MSMRDAGIKLIRNPQKKYTRVSYIIKSKIFIRFLKEYLNVTPSELTQMQLWGYASFYMVIKKSKKDRKYLSKIFTKQNVKTMKARAVKNLYGLKNNHKIESAQAITLFNKIRKNDLSFLLINQLKKKRSKQWQTK